MKMKRAVSVLLSLVLLLSCLSGCRHPGEQPEPPSPISEPTEQLSVQELAEAPPAKEKQGENKEDEERAARP